MGKCCIEGCTSSDNVEYFQFPASKALRASWLAACGAPGAVCAAHFSDEDYTRTRGGRRLRGGAVPRATQNAPSKTVTEESTVDANKQTNNGKEDELNKHNEIPQQTVTETVTNTIEVEIKGTRCIEDARVTKDGGTQAVVCVKEKGNKVVEIPQTEEKDIEDMITNYQIKQTKTLADRLNPEPLEDLIPSIMSDPAKLDLLSKNLANSVPKSVSSTLPKSVPNTLSKDGAKWDSNLASELASKLASKLDSQLEGMLSAAPVFIEVPVNKDTTNSRPASPEDCLMLLESVQCDIDPSSLMLPDHAPDTDSDMEIVSCDRKEDPISLLTSSDEDEVIIEEPHIDTVEVSDETDEDDKPLTTLIKTKKEKVKTEKSEKTAKSENLVWGMYEFYCVQCDFRTENEIEYKKHMLELEHSTAIQICPVCSYTTASKAQYSRHRRKHRDERNYKCHLCKYKARHKMSLMYHLKSHNVPSERRPKFICDKCGFSSNLKSEGLKHIKICDEGVMYCDDCTYSTKRKSDMRRHRLRRHSIDDDDEDFRA